MTLLAFYGWIILFGSLGYWIIHFLFHHKRITEQNRVQKRLSGKSPASFLKLFSNKPSSGCTLNRHCFWEIAIFSQRDMSRYGEHVLANAPLTVEELFSYGYNED